MGLELNGWSLFKTSKLNPVVSQANTRPTDPREYDDGYTERAIDEIKKSFVSNVNPYTPYLADGYEFNETEMAELNAHYTQYLMFNEFHCFFNDKMKTDLGPKILDEIIDNLFDTESSIYKGDKKVDDVTIKKPAIPGMSEDTSMDIELLEEIASYIAVYGKCGVSVNFRNGEMQFEAIEPWRYLEIPGNNYRILHINDRNVYVEEKMINQVNHIIYNADGTKDILGAPTGIDDTLFIELKGERLFTDGVMHYLLLHSDILTSVVQENDTTRSALFIDKGFLRNGWLNRGRRFFTQLNTPQTGDMGTSNKPTFETYNPNIRSEGYKGLLEIIEVKIAKSMRIYSVVERTSNATSGIIVDARDAKRYNKLKARYSKEINKLFDAYIGNNYRLELSPYKLENKEAQIKNAVLMNSNNLGHERPLIDLLYPEWSQEERDIYYLSTEIKNGRKLTKPEEEQAIELGLMDKPEPVVDPATGVSPPANQSGNDTMVSDGQIDNADKVNSQGVPLPAMNE